MKFRHAGAIVTPVKTGVHPHPQNLDTVLQRYDGRGPPPGYRVRGNDGKEKVEFESTQANSLRSIQRAIGFELNRDR
jgi:hypothetical protein